MNLATFASMKITVIVSLLLPGILFLGLLASCNFQRPDLEELRKHGVDRPDRVDMVESAIEEQLIRKGYKRVTQNPDLIVTYFARVKNLQKANTTSVAVGGSTGGYSSRFGYSVGASNTKYIDCKEGTLIVDLVDAGKNLLVWEGIGSDTFDERKDLVQDKIYSVVDRIFYNYKFQAGQ